MVRTKVFVGNLSFQTKEAELAKEFEAAGKVISANIITRGPRSLGYGFVEMENLPDAENAVKLLSKKEINGRPINVEIAKPRDETAQPEEKDADASRGGFRGRGRGRGRGTFRGGFRGRGGPTTGFAPRGTTTRGGFRGGRGRGGAEGGRGGANANANANANNAKPAEDRTPSKTTLFVANLPFSLDDAGFSKVLKDHNLTFKAAHVVIKKNGRSKGFGFIEFENEIDQQKALNALNDKEVEGRALVVKVALTESPRQEGGKQEEQAPATNNATPAPKQEKK
jgi:RNA recognition motif-containing protein